MISRSFLFFIKARSQGNIPFTRKTVILYFIDALLYDIDVKAEINIKNSKVLGNGPDI